MVLGDTTTFFYQFIFGENDSNDTKIIQCFIMYVLVLCIKLNSFVEHMLYVWSFSHNAAVSMANNHNNFFPSLNT